MVPYGVRERLHRVRCHVERRVRQVFYGATLSWTRQPNARPWFDLPDALDRVASLRGTADVALLEKWVRDGYVVVDDYLDTSEIDAMLAVLDGLWDDGPSIANLVVLGVRDEIGGARRFRLAIHGFHYVNRAASRIYRHRGLRRLASRLLGRRARPIAAINFMVGSEQALHQDMAVFHIYPHNYLLGAWIACEDIGAESGPLVVYPGSHRAEFFPGFTAYPQTNLRTADAETTRTYQDYVDAVARHFERREFVARKGQVLLWHGMLIHGGAPIQNRSRSRKSMVLHYSVRGADRAREVEGPFNW
jgi:ectoine hydroxylase-related dioxygenase (phytanoyl-CoA dioxygenase family)